jgi:hypothetical protein
MSTWRDEADRLRAEGKSISEIARTLGKARSSVGDHVQLRCACGNHRTRTAKVCRECHDRHQAEVVDLRLRALANMYNRGVPFADMAAAWGRGDATGLGPDIQRARDRGYITHYRYATHPRRREVA